MIETHLSSILNGILARGDLADLILFVWAMAASAAAFILLRDLNAANARFEDFIRELHRFNANQE